MIENRREAKESGAKNWTEERRAASLPIAHPWMLNGVRELVALGGFVLSE